jgi:hypothetical protein
MQCRTSTHAVSGLRHLRFCLWLALVTISASDQTCKTKDGIEQYFRHDVKFNNINGKLRTRTLQGIGELKRGRSKSRVYLKNQQVYINKAHLGNEDGIALGWTW